MKKTINMNASRATAGSNSDTSEPIESNDVLINFGQRLRSARRIKNYKLKELADKVGCSESFLSKVENDKVKPSLQMLHRILAELNTSIAYLFSDKEKEHSVVMRNGERHVIPTGSNHLRKNSGVQLEWLIPNPESSLLSGAIHIIAPGGGSEGLITHEGEEVGYVLQGKFELTLNDNLYKLNPGDSFCFRSDIPHGYHNPGRTETRVIWINTPPTF